MRALIYIPLLMALAACGGGDVPSDTSFANAEEASAQRDAAQEGRIRNEAALACVKANSSEEEWAIIIAEGEGAGEMLQAVLNRAGTRECFTSNNVVVLL